MSDQKQFDIKVNTSLTPTDVQATGWQSTATTYTVVFTNCNFTLVKRGIQPFWNVDIAMEQV